MGTLIMLIPHEPCITLACMWFYKFGCCNCWGNHMNKFNKKDLKKKQSQNSRNHTSRILAWYYNQHAILLPAITFLYFHFLNKNGRDIAGVGMAYDIKSPEN